MMLKNVVYNYWQQILLLLTLIGVFCFWYFCFPYVLVMRESMQLFLWNSQYFMERVAVPGGLAQYIGEFLAQYFMNPMSGAAIYAVLFVVEQWLSAQLLQRAFPTLKNVYRFVLSLLVPLALGRLAMIPEVPLTPTIAVILVMAVMVLMPSNKKLRVITSCMMIPVMYWLVGPAAILLVLCCIRWVPLTATLFAACLLGSSWVTPYPLQRIARGVDYYWGTERNIGSYEQMECDMLMRLGAWSDMIEKYRYPNSVTVASAVKVASYETGQMDRTELFASMVVPEELQTPAIFSSNGLHMRVNFESLVAVFMVSDIAMLMNMPTVAQRSAFEAMEFIPNYNKSGRALKRLVETNLIIGNYQVALKYLDILEETANYSKWAQEMRPLAEHPERLQQHPFFQKAQESFQKAEDMFFI